MESEIMNTALSQGIWAVISVFLLFYILRAQEKRYSRYKAVYNKKITIK